MVIRLRRTLFLLVGIVFPDLCSGQLQNDRVDCHPDIGVSEASCLSRGCLFDDDVEADVPVCYYPPLFGYVMYGQPQQTETGIMVVSIQVELRERVQKLMTMVALFAGGADQVRPAIICT